MRKIHIQEYKDYLKRIQGSIHKILPLYEDLEKLRVGNLELEVSPEYIAVKHNLNLYVNDLYVEVDNVLSTIEVMPHGAWYFTTKSGLKTLVKGTAKIDNHKNVRRLVFHLQGVIQTEILMIEE